ncbi:hypothetical protein BMW22_27460 (plasmid) [Rhizobium leguminosarum]|uniref:Uncharacterized protein n=1 Tax=Rhizobium leguminosarum TaxID=384 RepID=A0A1B1CN19_RHILE|nr:hypothetical protein BA011_35555 [Rhizobium leguminosarum]API55284.1 hypothetical protein BMW22_27460 [Rhizobium leguminosarum]
MTRLGSIIFSSPDDELALAQKARQLRRNSFGYSADTCTTEIGFGGSTIGLLCEGYAQNELTQYLYSRNIGSGRIALTSEDRLAIIERRNGTITQLLLIFGWTQWAKIQNI